MSAIKPLNDKVLIERTEAVDKSAGGILLPDSAKEKPTEGRVIAAGDGRWNDDGQRVPLTVKPGDRVLFSAYAGTQVKESGKEYLILDESEVLAVLDEKPWSAAAGSGKSEKSDEPKTSKKK